MCLRELAVLIIIGCLQGNVHGQGQCTGMTSCYCQFENGQFMDLSSLGRTDGMPRFVNISDDHEMSYSWNPCFNFTEGECTEVAICAIESSIPHNIFYTLGYQHQTQFTTNVTDNTVSLVYTTSKGKAYVKLVCDRESVNNTYFTAIGQRSQTSTDYYFRLNSPIACPQGNPRPVTTIKPPDCNDSKKWMVGTIVATSGCVILSVLLIIAVLKIKGKICKKVEYDEL